MTFLAGYGFGSDSLTDNALEEMYGIGESHGFFFEVDIHPVEDKVAVGARYDFFDPLNKIDANEMKAFTVFANVYFVDGLQLIADFQHKDAEQPPAGLKKKSETFGLRLIPIW